MIIIITALHFTVNEKYRLMGFENTAPRKMRDVRREGVTS
jgi:hypothetical protein